MRFEFSWLAGGPMVGGGGFDSGDANVLKRWTNCKVVEGDSLVSGEVWTRGARIVAPSPRSAHVVIDLGGRLLSPGLIEVQINGGWGVDLSGSDTECALTTLAARLPETGVTAFLPTLVTSSPEKYHQVSRISLTGRPGAVPLGWHLEGPFLAPTRNGAHDQKLLRTFRDGISSLDEVYGELGRKTLMITMAPEIENALSVIEELNKRRIVVSLGHSEANVIQGEEGIHRGARCLTHLWNGMAPLGGREPGLGGLLMAAAPMKRPYFTIIPDGIHVHPASLRIALASHPAGCVIVTDAVSPFGSKPGKERYTLGKMVVEDRGGAAYVAGTWKLAGGMTSMIDCVAKLVDMDACSLPLALKTATARPAEMLGLSDRGVFKPGARADMVLLDPHMSVLVTWIGGNPVYVNKKYRGPQ